MQLEGMVRQGGGDVVSPLYLLGPVAKPPQELSAEEQRPQGGQGCRDASRKRRRGMPGMRGF
jgi:hypothetical protein